jgi:transposase
MEATGVYWKPVWHVLDGHFELILANASHIKNVPGRKTGSDLGEARDRDLAMRGVTVGFWRSVGADA